MHKRQSHLTNGTGAGKVGALGGSKPVRVGRVDIEDPSGVTPGRVEVDLGDHLAVVGADLKLAFAAGRGGFAAASAELVGAVSIDLGVGNIGDGEFGSLVG